jgi:hypothetical protein
MDARAHDAIFKGFSLVVPLAASIRNTSLHGEDPVVFMHESATSFSFLAKANYFSPYSRVVEANKGSVDVPSHLWLFKVSKFGVVRNCRSWVRGCEQRLAVYTTTAAVSTHNLRFAGDMVHSKLDEGGLVKYLVALRSRRDHDVSGVCVTLLRVFMARLER